MVRATSRTTLVIVGLVWVAICPRPAGARIYFPWDIERIAQTADVIAAGEVREVSIFRRVAREETRWRVPLLQKEAKIRVLRSLSKPGASRLSQGKVISVRYVVLPPPQGWVRFEGPKFPDLSVGDVYAFPLREIKSLPWEKWVFLDDEDFGQLVPCIRSGLSGAPRSTGVEFLHAELAGALAKGDYGEIYQAATYLTRYHGRDPRTDLDPVYALLARHLKDDEDRWLGIAVATYCGMGRPKPTIAELRSPPEDLRSDLVLQAKALSHVSEPVERRFLEVALEHAGIHASGTAAAFLLNYSPAARRLLEEGLKRDAPESLRVTWSVIRDDMWPLHLGDRGSAQRIERDKNRGFNGGRTKELVPAALAAARRLLLPRSGVADQDLMLACVIIRGYGEDDDFALVLDEIRRAQKTDVKRYSLLWRGAFTYAKAPSPRSIAVCAILIEDRRIATRDPSAAARGIRFCDKATYDLQKVAGADFGFASRDPVAKRDEAIEQAKTWLEKNASVWRR